MARAFAAAVFGATVATFLAGASHAQSVRSDYHEQSFDMWCQEEQHLPPARCDKRLPKDDADYRAYLDVTESYETQRLNGVAHDRQLDRLIRSGNPSDNPSGVPVQNPRPPQPQQQ